ncbi:MAG: alpha/beta fold hydrolase [Clostridia bacterium]
MKKIISALMSVLICIALTGCGETEDMLESSSNTTAPDTISVSDKTENPSLQSTEPEATRATEISTEGMEKTSNGGQDVTPTEEKEYTYTTQELWCSNSGKKIYGQIYLPDGVSAPMPAVILSHSFSLTHASMNSYCINLAKKGYAAYCFDFCGGSTSSKSDGETSEMTVFTEVCDLEAVLDHLRSLSYIDRDNIFLLGTSQGGLVSALAAAERPTQVRGLILMYPGFSIAKQVTDFFKNPDDLDQLFDLPMISMMPVGENYVKSLYGYDVYEHIKSYSRDVLILHGSNDLIVPPSYSERAVEVYPHATLHIIEGAGHGFNKENFSISGNFDGEVLPYVFEYLQVHTT